MNLDPKVQRIIDWRESFATLPDTHFFELIRMYLGEVKTPYNKQKLIEELGAFIRKEENKERIISLLTKKDLEIISAIKYIPFVTQEKLAAFYSDTYSYAELYEIILNLEERLILYRCAVKENNKIIININPLLEECLAPYISIDLLINQVVYAEKEESIPFTLNPQFIASFVAFAEAHHDMCKDDGFFKKRTITELRTIYSNSKEDKSMEDRLQFLVRGLCNLGLFHEDDNGITVDKKRLSSFAELPPSVQYSYLCVASCGRFSRSAIRLNAQLLLDVLSSIPREGYTLTSIQRLTFITQQKFNIEQENFSQGRLAQLYGQTALQTDAVISSMLNSCVVFGVLYKKGKNPEGNNIYSVSPLFTEQKFETEVNPKVLSIDAGFSVTIMPGLSLFQLLSLVEFMNCSRYDTAIVFEISKESVMRSFDSDLTTNEIFSLLEKYSSYEIPQNLRISIDEWYGSFSSAAIYKGYVLKVNTEKCRLVENNPILSPYIKKILSPGIFLLDISNDEEVKIILQKSGLDFIGNIKTTKNKEESVGYPILTASNINLQKQNDVESIINKLKTESEQRDIINIMKNELDKQELSEDQKDGLIDRIERRIIINPVQLRGSSVRFEKLEAGGMDYNGKLHVIDSAIASESMIEIICDEETEPVVCTPIFLNKKSENAYVHVRLEPDQTECDISVGRAQRIKKLRGRIK